GFMTQLSRALVMPGDGTWELRELPVPDPPPGGAVLRGEASGWCHSGVGHLPGPDPPRGGAGLRVEASGMCHSDVDHLLGIVHTPYGGAYPSIAGHEIVGRLHALGDGNPWGAKEGQRAAGRAAVA